MGSVTEADLAYTAGIIDGEGYIGIRNTPKRCYIDVVVVSTDPRLPLWLQEHWLGNLSKQRMMQPGQRPAFRWNVHSRQALAVLKAIRPFMVLKGERADVAMAFQATLWYRGKQPVSAVELATRNEMATRLRLLNRRGIA